ncbi:hypothetical protein DPMN_055432 [Dreissena polymorpha]|uniref:Uncharacterized protein n=1 Tax=Dreissena polymorpha TaxID=45954 RepID=A0A9D4HSL7_DREPO|nr:hypothetical protein DPMN_055432 [Dreissena polymorpha]
MHDVIVELRFERAINIKQRDRLVIFNKMRMADWTKNVTSRVVRRLTAPSLNKAPPRSSKFHKDCTINVTSKVLTSFDFELEKTINVASSVIKANVDDGQKAITKAHHEQVVLS